ncbi:hypothetical protein [Dyella acidiphila]|uniref:Uncharacterized protein n=1 Tax=Dyella acidiphila TaxID=2775866 RepID=A0ABR9GCK3_9GAMM|nr:hypothetical protein [Dyella acidiphila]MBE1161770.1 hypothetical protein [Dyella acidiphila]
MGRVVCSVGESGDFVNSWDRSKVIEKVASAADELGASNPQQQRQLVFSCGNATEKEAYFGLMSFFYDPNLQKNHYERQKLAATILLSVAPSSPIALDASVYASAQHWNLSVSELPSYWCKVFGREEVIAFLDDLIDSCSEPKLKRSVEAMLFWARRYE